MNKDTAKTLKPGDKLRGERGAFGAAHETGTVEFVYSDGVQIRCQCGQLNEKVTFEGNDGFWACIEIEQPTPPPAPTSVAIHLYENVCAERDRLLKTVKQYRTTLPILLARMMKWRQRAVYVREKYHEMRRERDAWVETARQHARNETYYRDLLLQIAEVLGPEKYLCDSGDVSQDVLVAKVPELARAAILNSLSAAHKAKQVQSPMVAVDVEGFRTKGKGFPVFRIVGK